ncbi:MAG: hypothetical protein FI735_10065 [SAR202 cluster bacterium]|nr:hypothetical protein [SAR202 cluster bacterium]|tara:strand:+ start:1623 stop:1949 length:327 start_codon:yes stop_codon:yes gene_type:complete
MTTKPRKLNGISIKTARMLEIYSLLVKELERGKKINLSSEDHNRLDEAIRTISRNMEEIQSTNVNDGVNISTDVETLASDLSKQIPMDTLDNIMDAVLKRHIADQNEN